LKDCKIKIRNRNLWKPKLLFIKINRVAFMFFIKNYNYLELTNKEKLSIIKQEFLGR
jgi:hypothetical protein